MAVAGTKKILLQKLIENNLYNIFPKTEATVVEFTKGQTVTTVAAELAQLATDIAALPTDADLEALRTEIIGELGDNEQLAAAFDTIKEISEFLDQNDSSIEALAGLIADVGVASAGANPATGIHLAVENLQTAVQALQDANGTNVSKTKGSDTAGNGELYLDGTLTTVYDDTALQNGLGKSTDTKNASGTTAWSRIKNAEADIDALESGLGTSSATASSTGTTAWSRIKNAETDIDNLESGLGKSTDAAAAAGTTAWARIKALEAVEATKVEAATTNGYIKVNNTDDAIKVYDDTAIKNALGTSTTAASSTGTTAWSRIKNAESDIDTLEASVGKSSNSASSSATNLWARLKNAEAEITTIKSGLGTSADTANAAGTTAWSRIKAIQAQPAEVQYVTATPATPVDGVLYLVNIA